MEMLAELSYFHSTCEDGANQINFPQIVSYAYFLSFFFRDRLLHEMIPVVSHWIKLQSKTVSRVGNLAHSVMPGSLL